MGGKGNHTGHTGLRRTLVVIQFSISIFLIAGSLTVHRQMTFVNNRDLGYDKDLIISLPFFRNDRTLYQNVETIKSEFGNHPGVRSITTTFGNPFTGKNQQWGVTPEGFSEPFQMPIVAGDEAMLDTYGLELTSGRYFSRDHPGDANNAFLLNERRFAFSVGTTRRRSESHSDGCTGSA